MLRSVFLILSGNAFASLLSFARNLVVARLLSVEDYGIAATLALSMTLVEMFSTIGLQQLIVQDSRGDDADFQAGLQGFHLARGVIAALALLGLAYPIAAYLGVPHLVWAYQALAFIPLVRGFEHFDIHRLTRQRAFGPNILYKVVPTVIAFACIWPLAAIFDDYRMMLFSLLVQYAVSTLVSQLLRQRPYRLSFDPAIIRQSLVFGWPLLVNNILLFGVMQGDRLVVGGELGLEELAIFSMGMTLTMTPMMVLTQSLSLFMLPRLSAARANPDTFARLARTAIQAGMASGLLLVLATALIGGPLVHLLLGSKYDPLIPLMLWLAIRQALWTFKAGASVIAVAGARTQLPMRANLVRILALPVAWLAAIQGASLTAIILIAAAGELAAFLYGIVMLHRWFTLNQRAMTPAFLLSGLCLATAGLLAALSLPLTWGLIALTVLTAAALALMTDMTGSLRRR